MSSSLLGSKNMTSDGSLLKEHRHARGSSQQQHSNKLAPGSEPRQVSSLAFLPILGLIIFVVCSFLKVYKWSKDDARWKARGDVEFGDEAEVNYGIIHVGDKDFCPIDIRSDGASVYDTVNSFRFLTNGYTTQFSDTYHDTVTSYKSLWQRADGSQYDSIKSYKSFLQKAAHNKELAVQVKLLDNYPVRSESADHCVTLEDGRKSEAIISRMQSALPLIEHLHKEGQLPCTGKRKSRQGRSSGLILTTSRKQSLPNPLRAVATSPACSLPSICHTFSCPGHSTEDSQHSSRTDRHTNGKNKQTVSHSSLGVGNISGTTVPSTEVRRTGGSCKKRRRHYSADSSQRSVSKEKRINNDASPNDSVKTVTEMKTTTKVMSPVAVQRDTSPVAVQRHESSSENPTSSHSSDTDILSDTLTTESDSDAIKGMPLSALSDDQALDNDIFVSFSSADQLPHPIAVFQGHPPKLPSQDTKMLLAHARSKFFNNKLNNAFSVMSPDSLVSCPPPPGFVNNENCCVLHENNIQPVEMVRISAHINHSISDKERPG